MTFEPILEAQVDRWETWLRRRRAGEDDSSGVQRSVRHTPGGHDHDQDNHAGGGGVRYFVDASVLSAARAQAAAKYSKTKPPTEAERAQAEYLYAKYGAEKVERNQRGNSTDRRRSRQRLAREFGDGTGCPCVYCGAWLGVDRLERDRLYPGQAGGRYRHDNLVPADANCNKKRGTTPFEDIVVTWNLESRAPKERDRGSLPPDGTVVTGTEASTPDSDFKPRTVSGPMVSRYVEGLDYWQVLVDGAVVEPESVEETSF